MIRFGIIGTNWISDALITSAKQGKNVSITAVYSRKEETAALFAKKHEIAHTFTSLEAFSQSTEFDAVYIASPNSFHASQAIQCMKEGKHVLCEKPLASNTKEIEEMISVATSSNVVLMEAMKSIHTPNFAVIKNNLDKLGPIRRFTANYCQYSSRYDAFKRGEILNAFRPEYANGALMDLGIYGVAAVIHLFGKPHTIQASNYLLHTGVDGEGSMICSYDEMDAIVTYSKITNSFVPSEIQGENGSMLIDSISSPTNVTIRYNNGETEDLSVPQSQHNMKYEVETFLSLMENNELVHAFYEQSLHTMQVVDEARKQVGPLYDADRL